MIIVDDNSPDGTGKLAESLSHSYPISTIHRNKKLGLGSAVIEGFKFAKGDILGVMDADLSHPVEAIPKILEELKNFDLVIGSRLTQGGIVEKWSLPRKIISGAGVCLARFLTKTRDPLSGFFFFKRSVIKNVTLCCDGYKILLEILVKGNYLNCKEVPIIFKPRTAGKSKLNFNEYIDYLKLLGHLYFHKLKNRRETPEKLDSWV
jgi:dolichol-phosphate mannosyltransferase